MNKPTPQQIKQARKEAGLTQKQAGELVHVEVRTWQKWEYGERPMSAAVWELFNLKINQ
jgi:DNA (cytosine-5)-methyltransferase 1